MGDIIKEYNVREVAFNFYEWLIEHGYRESEDFEEDIDDIILDFEHIKENVPMLFHLLIDISDR